MAEESPARAMTAGVDREKYSWNPGDPRYGVPRDCDANRPYRSVAHEPGVDPTLTRWLPGMLALGAIWGSSFLFIKVGVSELHPLYVAMGRVASGALVLLLILLATGGRLPREAAPGGTTR